jgi:hypothetical protein
MKKVICLTGFCVFLFYTLSAQENNISLINSKTVGILVEYGSPYYFLPEGIRYYPLLIGGTFKFPIFKAKKFFNMSVGLFPHYGKVWVDSIKRYYEFGLNLRLGFNLAISDKDVIRLIAASGPQYINVETEKQAKGFVFSDNYLLNYERLIYLAKQPFSISFEAGFRHISNAGIKEPNRSINNFIFGIGINYVF